MASNSDKNTGKASSGCAGTSGSVLVVDDNEVLAHALAKILDQEGWRVAICYNGSEALSQIEKELPSAAVVDIHLPDISGLVLSSKLRERFGPDRPIIVLSGDASMENLRSLPHVGATYFISKPFNSQHLIDRLRELSPGCAQ